MPFINTITSKKIDKAAEKELRESYGKLIELIPGKTEEYLMLNFEDCARMAFRANAEDDCAIITVEIYGKGQEKDLEKLAKEITLTVSRVLGIVQNRIYVKYAEVDYWYGGTDY